MNHDVFHHGIIVIINDLTQKPLPKQLEATETLSTRSTNQVSGDNHVSKKNIA